MKRLFATRLALALAVLAPALASAQAGRRVVAVCPIRFSSEFDARLQQDINRWLNEALVQKRIARADPAVTQSELKAFDQGRCPADEAGRIEFARLVGATDLLQVNVWAPAIVAGILVRAQGAPGAVQLDRVTGDPSRGPLSKVLREAITGFVDRLPILAGEELITPLTEEVPKNLTQAPYPPVTPSPVAKAPIPTGAWLLMGTGAASLVGGSVGFVLAALKDQEFSSLQASRVALEPQDLTRLRALQQEGTQLRTIGTGLFVLGAAAGLAGGGWALYQQFGGGRQPCKSAPCPARLRPIAEAAAAFITQRVGASVDTITLGEGTADVSFRAQGLSGTLRYALKGRRLFQVLVFSPAAKPALWSVFTEALVVSEDPGRTPFPSTYPEGDLLSLRGRGKGFRDLRSEDGLRLHGPKVTPVDGQLSMMTLAELLGLAAAAAVF